MAADLAAEFPALGLRYATVEAGTGRTPGEVHERVRTLANRFTGARVVHALAIGVAAFTAALYAFASCSRAARAGSASDEDALRTGAGGMGAAPAVMMSARWLQLASC